VIEGGPRLWGGALLSAVLLLAACPNGAAVSPEATLKAYIAALERGNYGRAYRLMSKSFRQEYDKDEFVTHHKRNRVEVKKNLDELKKGPSKLQVNAEFRYGEGSRIRLVMEGGAWKLSLDPVTFYSQRSPREALKSFVRALQRRRYKILMRFVPNQWKRLMTVRDIRRLFSKAQIAATRQLIRNLKANLDNKIEVSGDKAEMLYGDRYRVRFLREDGIWKIVDAD
jgi:hypothetical protein